ncbi:MAG: tRNA pseudouridine(54/55) synthase Pus10 [Candidatus Bathyarchaeota archaeon]|nr:tRNA pseudouridine(54/55) synthase Pus10 [Candidatus Bathyarchaeota archaeon]
MEDILEIAEKLLMENCLCDNCLGRQFATLGYGLDNAERGKILKNILIIKAHKLTLEKEKTGIEILRKIALNGMSLAAKNTLKKLGYTLKENKSSCLICRGKFQELNLIAEKCLKKAGDYEFNNFLVGVEIPKDIIEAEDSLRARYKISWGETIKSEFTREAGKILSKNTGKSVEYKKPDIVILFNPFSEEVKVQVNPLFVGGRYKKLVRGIPQSRWICKKCRGRGCKRCNWKGKMYEESVQEIIEKPILNETLGENTKFHASGREDVDALVLGNGRPFVIEVKNPRRRNINLKKIEDEVNKTNKVEVKDLYFADREMVRKIKLLEHAKKLYEAIVEAENGEITDEELKVLREKFKDVEVHQQTPKRVMHRRTDKVRVKRVYSVEADKLTPKKLKLKIECQGGLYIKELVDGDEGRTKPSISEILGKKLKCLELSVLDISC